jgi:hypothetical protein
MEDTATLSNHQRNWFKKIILRTNEPHTTVLVIQDQGQQGKTFLFLHIVCTWMTIPDAKTTFNCYFHDETSAAAFLQNVQTKLGLPSACKHTLKLHTNALVCTSVSTHRCHAIEFGERHTMCFVEDLHNFNFLQYSNLILQLFEPSTMGMFTMSITKGKLFSADEWVEDACQDGHYEIA